MTHEKAERFRKKLYSLEWIPQGELDDTRFEKLYDDLKTYLVVDKYGKHHEDFKLFMSLDPFKSVKLGVNHHDERARAISIRILGDFHTLNNEQSGNYTPLLKDVRILSLSLMVKYLNEYEESDVEPYEFISIIYLIEKWIPYLKHGTEDTFKYIALGIRFGMRHNSHFIQASTIKLLIALFREQYYDFGKTSIKQLLEDVTYCDNNRIPLMELTESLVHAKERKVLIETHLAIRNVWFGLRDNNSLISQRAREALKCIVTTRMEDVLLFDIPHLNSNIEIKFLNRLNNHIQYLIGRSTSLSFMNAIRIISHLDITRPEYREWIDLSLLTIFQLVNNQDLTCKNNAFSSIDQDLLIKHASTAFSCVIDVLTNLSKNNTSFAVLDFYYWIDFLIKSKGSSHVLISKLVKLISLILKQEKLEETHIKSIILFLIGTLQNETIRSAVKEEVLFCIKALMRSYFGKITDYLDIIHNSIARMSSDTKWEVRDNSLSFLTNLTKECCDQPSIEEFIVEKDFLALPTQLAFDHDNYVRLSAIQCLDIMCSVKSLASILLAEHLVIISTLLSKRDEEDPSVRHKCVLLLKRWFMDKDFLEHLTNHNVLNSEVIGCIKSYLDDDDWEVRKEYVQLLFDLLCEVLTHGEETLDDLLTNLACEDSILRATTDPIRLVRQTAWKGLQQVNGKIDASLKSRQSLVKLFSHLSTDSIEENLKSQLETEMYDEDDDVYPLEPSIIENDMDCPF